MADGKDKRAALLAEISLILAAAFWGTNYAATKFAARSIPPLSIVAIRFVVGGLLMYCVLRIIEPQSRLRRKDVLPMAGLGCLGVALAQMSFTFGISMTTAANTGLIFATAPRVGASAGIGARVRETDLEGSPGRGSLIRGGRSGLLGGDHGGGRKEPHWSLLILLAALGVGSYTVFSMPILGRHSPLAVATYPILFGGPLVLALSVPFFAGLEWEGVSPGAWAAVAFSAVFATAYAFSAWQTGISRIGAKRVLVDQYLITVTGVASGVVFFEENLGVEKLVGGAIILVGVYLARRQ